MDDERIVELYWIRSEQAINETKESYGSYCAMISGNILSRQDAEECVSDAYLKLWETIPPQRPRSLKAYLSKIVRNLSLDRLEKNRAKKRGGGQSEAVFDEICEFISASGEDLADKMALREAINSFLKGLEKQQRIIFLQRYYYFSSVKQIAAQFDMSQSNVKMTLKRTRDKLSEYLHKEGFEI